MKTPIKIGELNFSSKKEALLHYKCILNSYKFGQSLNDNDFDDLMGLLNYEYQISMIQISKFESLEGKGFDIDKQPEILVVDILISKVQFNTKCFEVFYNDGTSCYISYIMIINRQSYTMEKLFNTACRNCIQNDLMLVKREYFLKNSRQGNVKCQETNIPSKWDDLAVDHRQPNTLSVIIDRFKEVNNFDLDCLEYRTTKDNMIIFKDQDLVQRFILYHREKATLRIVRKERNLSRSAMGRIKRSAKDLTINQAQLPLF